MLGHCYTGIFAEAWDEGFCFFFLSFGLTIPAENVELQAPFMQHGHRAEPMNMLRFDVDVISTGLALIKPCGQSQLQTDGFLDGVLDGVFERIFWICF